MSIRTTGPSIPTRTETHVPQVGTSLHLELGLNPSQSKHTPTRIQNPGVLGQTVVSYRPQTLTPQTKPGPSIPDRTSDPGVYDRISEPGVLERNTTPTGSRTQVSTVRHRYSRTTLGLRQTRPSCDPPGLRNKVSLPGPRTPTPLIEP